MSRLPRPSPQRNAGRRLKLDADIFRLVLICICNDLVPFFLMLPFFCIGPKLRWMRSTPTASESMSEKNLECFANTDVNSQQRHVCAHQYATSMSPPVHLLSCELRKPIEKSACLGMTVRAITYLVGQGQTMGHRRRKAIPERSV